MRRPSRRHAASHDAIGAVLVILAAVSGGRLLQRRAHRRRRARATQGDKAAWLARVGVILPHLLPLIGLLEGARRALRPQRG